MSDTEVCTEEVITTEVIVDAGSATGEVVVADMDNDFVAEEVNSITLLCAPFGAPLNGHILTLVQF